MIGQKGVRKMAFNDKLSVLLRESGYTQSDLSRRLKVGRQAVSAWMTGRYKPKSDLVHKIALIFNVSESWLMDIPGAEMERVEQITPEISELIRIYKLLDVRGRTKLMATAYKLEEGGSDGEL